MLKNRETCAKFWLGFMLSECGRLHLQQYCNKNHTIINKEKGETMNSYKIAVTHDGLHAKPDVAGGLCME